jgi:hypothetical protein
MKQERGLALMQMPLEVLKEADSQATPEDEPPRRWPKRIRIPTLDYWRNESVVLERLADSEAPSVVGVRMNFAPRMENMGERTLPTHAVQQAVPMMLEDQELEFVTTDTGAIMSKLVILPPPRGRANPPTYTVPPFQEGTIFVLEGSLRCGYENDVPDKALLQPGDVMLLPAGDREVLVAPAAGSSAGVKFKLYLVAGGQKANPADAVMDQEDGGAEIPPLR